MVFSSGLQTCKRDWFLPSCLDKTNRSMLPVRRHQLEPLNNLAAPPPQTHAHAHARVYAHTSLFLNVLNSLSNTAKHWLKHSSTVFQIHASGEETFLLKCLPWAAPSKSMPTLSAKINRSILLMDQSHFAYGQTSPWKPPINQETATQTENCCSPRSWL